MPKSRRSGPKRVDHLLDPAVALEEGELHVQAGVVPEEGVEDALVAVVDPGDDHGQVRVRRADAVEVAPGRLRQVDGERQAVAL